MKILNTDRLSRLAHTGVPNEPIHRRLVVDKAAKRFRAMLAGALWDTKMTQWLHNVLCDNLSKEYLAAYMDILQTLRPKIPSLIDKMVAGRVHEDDRLGRILKEGVRTLLKKRWDPAGYNIATQKLVCSFLK